MKERTDNDEFLLDAARDPARDEHFDAPGIPGRQPAFDTGANADARLDKAISP